MEIYFSEKFKTLRKTHDLTQDQIAEILHVSPQAVSRWETGATYPDINMLPAIANFFEVTIDELLGFDVTKKEERIEEIIKQMCDAIERNATDDEIEVVSNGLKEFPNNLYFLDRLAGAYWNKMWDCKQAGNETEMRKYANESIKIFERFISGNENFITMPIPEKYGCTYESVRSGALQGIAYTYHTIGEYEKAVEWADKLPILDCTKEMVLARILEDDKKIERLKLNINSYIYELLWELESYVNLTGESEKYKTLITELENNR